MRGGTSHKYHLLGVLCGRRRRRETQDRGSIYTIQHRIVAERWRIAPSWVKAAEAAYVSHVFVFHTLPWVLLTHQYVPLQRMFGRPRGESDRSLHARRSGFMHIYFTCTSLSTTICRARQNPVASCPPNHRHQVVLGQCLRNS